jgi:hypothetical protein
MPLSWNEIRHRAIQFAHNWAGTRSEAAEKQTFWNEFFDVFGIQRRLVASFEEPVKRISGQYGYIDLFWKATLLVEHKSFGQDLGKAQSQAFQYLQDLLNEGRAKDAPRYVIVSDFARIALHDLEPEDGARTFLSAARPERQRGPAASSSDVGADKNVRAPVQPLEFPLAEFHKHIHAFAFIPGYKQHRFADQDPINLEATEIMGHLHDTLEGGGYRGHQLERFLVRVLFCLFAEDTGLFERDAFQLYLENRTAPDGSDLGQHLTHLFRVLDTPEDKRQKNLDETLAAFPYVNGELFREHDLDIPDFNRDMRNALLACTRFDWSAISPAIFGSLFQAIMEPRERRQIGGHYTSERDILKVIRSLFLDDLRAEFERIGKNKAELRRFHERLAGLRFLDPACGCGNFLVITYRELRLLELAILQILYGAQRELTLDVNKLSQVDVDQFYGIEIAEWPARIAEVALWLMDHQMNIRLSEAFGQLYRRLPLKKSPHIHQANALRVDWREVLPPDQCSYVLGNPPFVGKHYQNKEQKADMVHVFRDFKNIGDIDYVVSWFYRAAEYIQGTKIPVGLVATNSITQGEQVPLVWGLLFGRFKVKILFAHRTFPWESEARGKAHVHVVVIGFGAFDKDDKRIYDYDSDPQHPTVAEAKNISPYLTPGADLFVTKRQEPLCDIPTMRCGNKPTDDGKLLFTEPEKQAFLREEPGAKKFFKRFTGSEEFINGNMRWCLWLGSANPEEIRALPKVLERVRAVREFRERSTAAPTRQSATNPQLFFYISQPTADFIAVPEVSSIRRRFIPIGVLPSDIIVSNKIYVIPSASRFLFGILCSTMHMAWVRQVCGRLKSDFQYSGTMVYNTFPWPQSPTAKQKEALEAAGQKVLDVRAQFLAPVGQTSGLPVKGACGSQSQPSCAGTGATAAPPEAALTGGPEVSPAKSASLADLYDPLSMPPALVKAHTELDRAVDLCYRPQPFTSERQRVEYLFGLYEQLTAPLLTAAKPKRPRKRVSG